MILQKLAKNDSVPPKGYRFTVPETGYKIEKKYTLNDLFFEVEKHYKDNNIPLPDNWRDLVEDQLCRQLPEGWCQYTDGKPAEGATSFLSFDNIMKGLKSLSSIAANAVSGNDVFVSQEEADSRAAICARCYYNQKSGFCMGCGGARVILDMVASIKGSRTTYVDYALDNCGICGCRNDAIVHVKKNLLLTGEKEEITNKRPDWCWLKNDNLSEAHNKLHL
jgi:hypothetical protein